MKLTKSKLKQIIKEELGQLAVTENEDTLESIVIDLLDSAQPADVEAREWLVDGQTMRRIHKLLKYRPGNLPAGGAGMGEYPE